MTPPQNQHTKFKAHLKKKYWGDIWADLYLQGEAGTKFVNKR